MGEQCDGGHFILFGSNYQDVSSRFWSSSWCWCSAPRACSASASETAHEVSGKNLDRHGARCSCTDRAAVRARLRRHRVGADRNFAILYILLALGLNIVVGFAGLLDLGYVAFYAVGAYTYALLASPHFDLHLPFWVIVPIGAALAAFFGLLLGAPTLKLRGDYLAIVTLGFGEIVRIFLNNLSRPVNITNGPQGVTGIDPFRIDGFDFAQYQTLLGLQFSGPIKYYYLLLAVVIAVIVINLRLQNSRIGRAWEAIREDEIAASAMGINTRNVKLLAFAMGASFGGLAGGMFSAMQAFISPESFVLVESIMVVSMVVLGGMGNVWGRDPRGAAAVVRARDPALDRAAAAGGAARAATGRSRGDPHADFRPGAGAGDACSARRVCCPRRSGSASSRGRPLDAVARRSRHQALRRRAGAFRSLVLHSGRRNFRADRPERRRQDHALQRADRTLRARRRRFPVRRARPQGPETSSGGCCGPLRAPSRTIRLFANLSALENVMIGRHPAQPRRGARAAVLRDRKTVQEERQIEARAAEAARLMVGIPRPRERRRGEPALRRPAASRDRARARHRAEAARARTSPRRA